jgi:hypothetical protein
MKRGLRSQESTWREEEEREREGEWAVKEGGGEDENREERG